MSAARDRKATDIELPDLNTAAATALATNSYRDEKERPLVTPIAPLGLPANPHLTYLQHVSTRFSYGTQKWLFADGSTLSIAHMSGKYYLIRQTRHEHLVVPMPPLTTAHCQLKVLPQSPYAIVWENGVFILDINSMQFIAMLKEENVLISNEKALNYLTPSFGGAFTFDIIPLPNGQEIITVVSHPARETLIYYVWNLTNPLKPAWKFQFEAPAYGDITRASDGAFIFSIKNINQQAAYLQITKIVPAAKKNAEGLFSTLGKGGICNSKIIDNFLILRALIISPGVQKVIGGECMLRDEKSYEIHVLDISNVNVPLLLETISLSSTQGVFSLDLDFNDEGDLLISEQKISIPTLKNHFLLVKNTPALLTEHLRYANGQQSPNDVRHLVYQYLFDKPLLSEKFKSFIPESNLFTASYETALKDDKEMNRKVRYSATWEPLVQHDIAEKKEDLQIIAPAETITAVMNLITYIKSSMSKIVPDSYEEGLPDNKKAAILTALEKTLRDHTEKSIPLAQKKLVHMLMEIILTTARNRVAPLREMPISKTASGEAVFNLLSKKEKPNTIISAKEIGILRQLLFQYDPLLLESYFDSYEKFIERSYNALMRPKTCEFKNKPNTVGDVKQPQDSNTAELVMAINNRDYDKISWLMQRGANPNALVDITKSITPLAFAITCAEIVSIQIMLKYNPTIFAKEHKTPFIELLKRGKKLAPQITEANRAFANIYRLLKNHNALDMGNIQERIADEKSIEAVRKLARFAKSKTSLLRNISCFQDPDQDKNVIFTKIDDELKQELGKHPLALREGDLANNVLKIIQNAMRVRLGVTNQRTDSAEAIINLLSGKIQSNDIAPAEVGTIKDLLELYYLAIRTDNYEALREDVEIELSEMPPLVFGKAPSPAAKSAATSPT